MVVRHGRVLVVLGVAGLVGVPVNPDEEWPPDALDRLWRMVHHHDDTPLTDDDRHEVDLMEAGFNDPRADWYDRLGSFASFMFIAIMLTMVIGVPFVLLIQWVLR